MPFGFKPNMLSPDSVHVSIIPLLLYQVDSQKDVVFQENTDILYPHLTFNLCHSIGVNLYFTTLKSPVFTVIFYGFTDLEKMYNTIRVFSLVSIRVYT